MMEIVMPCFIRFSGPDEIHLISDNGHHADVRPVTRDITDLAGMISTLNGLPVNDAPEGRTSNTSHLLSASRYCIGEQVITGSKVICFIARS